MSDDSTEDLLAEPKPGLGNPTGTFRKQNSYSGHMLARIYYHQEVPCLSGFSKDSFQSHSF